MAFFYFLPPASLHKTILPEAIVIDLALTIPAIYFLMIRKGTIPKTTVIPVFVIGLVIATLILPKDQQNSLDFVKKWIAPVIELGALTYVSTKIYQARKAFKIKEQHLDFYQALKQATAEILPPKLSVFLATELATFYYGLLYWRKVKPKEFTYHQNTGTAVLLYALVGLVGIETIAFHLLLGRWSIVAAWILTVLSVYSGIQILGFAKSLSKRPIRIENNRLFLPYGIMAEANIGFDQIERIEPSKNSMELDKNTVQLSPLGDLDSYNLILHFKKHIQFTSFYGSKKECVSLAIFIDQKEEFLEMLQSKI
ncbi:hypothetical protein AFM12_12265 [Jiulongibacter sediminis]|uniref:PH domain-containing protein n=2 Tax=Jiulongibacter sediminis TaxID=1605367 RepID=A0A0P7C0N8_9BACT|nr:hypothetical protein AFM12_12265 [Jiulongibacter sediminis]